MSARKRPKGGKRGHARGHASYKVFISHSSRDKWIAERMAEEVEAAGADYWLDARDLPGGGDIQEEIYQAIQECQELVILFSPNSLDSLWIGFEVGVAYSLQKHLTPILNNVKYSDVTVIQRVKAIELNDFNQYLAELKNRIAAYEKVK